MKHSVPKYNWDSQSELYYNGKNRYRVTYFRMEYNESIKGYNTTFYNIYGVEQFKIFFNVPKEEYTHVYFMCEQKLNSGIIARL